MKRLEGEFKGENLRIGIAVSRFNQMITQTLLEGALARLRELGVSEDAITVAEVPGAFEIPVVAKKMAHSKKFDAVITLGAVIRGETAHFDYICDQTAKGIASIALETGIPVIFGVLTPYTMEQALARSSHGGDYAEAALEMASLLKKLD